MRSERRTTTSSSSQRTNQSSSRQTNQPRISVTGPDRVLVDLSRPHYPQKHLGKSSYSGGHNSQALFSQDSAPSYAPSNPRSHQSNDSWQSNYRPRVPAPLIRTPGAEPSSSFLQPSPRSHDTSHSQTQARDRYGYRMADPAPIRRSPPVDRQNRGRRRNIRIDDIPSSIDRKPSPTPSDSVSRSGSPKSLWVPNPSDSVSRSGRAKYLDGDDWVRERKRKTPVRQHNALRGRRSFDDEDYEEDSNSHCSYKTERTFTRNKRYPQDDTCPLGYTSKGPFW